jgi:hypothetical protein
LQSRIGKSGELPVGDRRTRGQRRDQRENQPDRRMQARKLRVAAEWQVDMHALQIGPAMRVAVENARIGIVDCGIAMRPATRLGARVHPWMHGGRHQLRPVGGQAAVERLYRRLTGAL